MLGLCDCCLIRKAIRSEDLRLFHLKNLRSNSLSGRSKRASQPSYYQVSLCPRE